MNLRRFLPILIPLGVLALMFLVFSNIRTPEGTPERELFLTWDNVRFIAAQSVTVAIAALGMTLIMAAGGIDLSVTAVGALSGVVAVTLLRAGHTPGVALVAALGVGALAGSINAAFITGFCIAPAIATLAMLPIARGVARALVPGRSLPVPPTWLDGFTARIPTEGWLPAPAVWIALGAALLTSVVARSTVFGRHVFAVGSNEATARLCGIRVPLTRVLVHLSAGIFFGLAGFLQTMHARRADPTAGAGLEVDIFAAALIGGANPRGGTGSVAGACVGAIIMTVLRNGVQQAGWPRFAEDIAVGAALLLAAAAAWKRNR